MVVEFTFVLFETVSIWSSGVRARSWKRARARMARKASWSVVQRSWGAQATSVRVPFMRGAASSPAAALEAKVALMEAKEEM